MQFSEKSLSFDLRNCVVKGKVNQASLMLNATKAEKLILTLTKASFDATNCS